LHHFAECGTGCGKRQHQRCAHSRFDNHIKRESPKNSSFGQ
jgi:hypothetical protein